MLKIVNIINFVSAFLNFMKDSLSKTSMNVALDKNNDALQQSFNSNEILRILLK